MQMCRMIAIILILWTLQCNLHMHGLTVLEVNNYCCISTCVPQEVSGNELHLKAEPLSSLDKMLPQTTATMSGSRESCRNCGGNHQHVLD